MRTIRNERISKFHAGLEEMSLPVHRNSVFTSYLIAKPNSPWVSSDLNLYVAGGIYDLVSTTHIICEVSLNYVTSFLSICTLGK